MKSKYMAGESEWKEMYRAVSAEAADTSTADYVRLPFRMDGQCPVGPYQVA